MLAAYAKEPSIVCSTAWGQQRPIPNRNTIIGAFGSWSAAWAFVGISVPLRARKYDRKTILRLMWNAAMEHEGSALTIKEWQIEKRKPSVSCLYLRFGSWKEAWDQVREKFS